MSKEVEVELELDDNIIMKPERSYIELNDDVNTGFIATNKLNDLISGSGRSSKISSLYQSFKDGE